MKKLAKLLAILIVVFMAVGCSSKKDDPKKLYEGVYEKMQTVKSMEMSLEADYALTLDGSALDMKMSIAGEVENENVHMVTSVEAFGYTSESEQWVIDGTGYQLSDGDYTKFDADSSPLDASAFEFDPSTVESYELSEKDGKQVIILTLSTKSLSSALDNNILNELGELDFDGIELSPIEITITKDYYVEMVTFSLKADIEGIAADITITMTLSNHNNTKVEAPDTTLWDSTGYNSENGTYTPSYSIEMDFTDADEAALAAAGFEKVDDNLYLNADGSISIDTMWKYFTLNDGNAYAEYDWEYQMATDYTIDERSCTIDYEYDEISEECTSEQIDRLNLLHDAFVALWNATH